MSEGLETAAQQAFSATIGRGAFSLGVTGVSKSANASQFTHSIAKASVNFGKEITLLHVVHYAFIDDLTQSAEQMRAARWRHDDGYFIIDVPHNSTLHSVLNDTNRLKIALNEWQDQEFSSIIIDCPPFGAVNTSIYTPMTAAALDCVLLVALPAMTSTEDYNAILKWLAQSDAKLSGVILNDEFNPTLKFELIREARRLDRFMPGLVRFIEKRIASWEPLSRHH